MTEFTVAPEELRMRAGELEALRSQNRQLLKQMRILVMSLSESWQGEAQEAFVKSFLSRNKAFTDLDNVMGEYIALVRKAASDAEHADQTLLAEVNRLLY